MRPRPRDCGFMLFNHPDQLPKSEQEWPLKSEFTFCVVSPLICGKKLYSGDCHYHSLPGDIQ